MIKQRIYSRAAVIILIGVVVFSAWPPLSPSIADDTVTVSASVGATVTCTSTPDGAPGSNFGTLTTSQVYSSTPNATTSLDCTYAAGCQLTIYDEGNGTNPGLASTTNASIIIGSADASWSDNATLAAGTEGYGIQAATSTAGSGQTLTVASRYNYYTRIAVNANNVGGLEYGSGSAVQIASSTGTIAGRELITYHKAAIAATTAAGAYQDTVTYSCLSN